MMLRTLLTLLLLTLARPAAADPALYDARAPGVTLYLLGSIHSLPPDTKWQTPAIDHAIQAADQFWFELILADAKPKLLALTMTYGFDPAKKLDSYLTPEEADQLQRDLEELKVPGAGPMLQMLRPWLAAITLTTARFMQDGFVAANGVDATLQAQARAADKPLIGLEDAEQQIRFLADLSDETGVAILRATLAAPGQGHALLAKLYQLWLAGDLDGVGRLMNEFGGSTSPELMEKLIYRRNAPWAEKLDTLKGKNVTAFVTVSAGHMGGPGNLRVLLAKGGFTIEPVPPQGTP